MKKLVLLLLLRLALYANLPFAAQREELPGTTINIFFPVYDYYTKTVVASWVDGAGDGFSTSFNGADWSSPLSMPNIGSLTGVLAMAYDPAINRVVTTFADASAMAFSSIYEGTGWAPRQSIPVPTDALLLFSAYDKAIGKLVATWSDTGSMISYSSVFDGVNWSNIAQTIGTTNAILVFPVYSPCNNSIAGLYVDTGTNEGYFATFDGTSWSSPTLISTNLSPPNFIPLFNISSMHDKLIATWVDLTTHQGFYVVFDGTSWSSPLEIPGAVAAGAIFPIFNPALDSIVVFWGDFTTNQGYFSVYDESGWSDPQIIPGATATSILAAYDPSIGKLVVTWSEAGAPPTQGYYSLISSPPITFTGTGNLANLAEYINSFGQTGAMQPILGRLNKLNSEQLEKALSSINFARNSFMPYMAGQTAIRFNQLLEFHSSELRWISMNHLFQDYNDIVGLSASLEMPAEKQPACKPADFGVWMEGIGSYSHQKEQDQNPSFNAYTGGALVSVDYFKKDMSFISSFAYAHTKIDSDGNLGKSDVDTVMALFNGCGSIARSYVELGISGVYNHYNSNRNIFFPGFNARARASFSGAQIIPHLAIGYDFCFCNWILEPFASADCAVIYQDSFQEDGAEPINANQPSNWSELLQARGGLRAYVSGAPCWGIWYFQMSGAYQYMKSWDVGSIANASFVGLPEGFTVISLESAQNCFVPGFEFFARFNKGLFTSVNYSGEFGSKYMSNSLFAKVGYFF